MTATRTPGDYRNLRVAATAGLALLLLVQTPQSIIQAGGGASLDREYGASLLIGATVLLAVALGYRLLTRMVPRTADHQLVARYISEPFSVVAAAAKLMSYALIVAIAAGFAVRSLSPLIDLGSLDLPFVQSIAIVVLAVPTLLGWQPGPRTLIATIAPAAASIGVIIVGGLIIELASGLKTLPEAGAIDSPVGVTWLLGGGVLGACLPAAVLGLMTERSFGEETSRRIEPRSLLTVMIPTILGIAALLYLSDVVSLPPSTKAPSVIALAEVFFPDAVVAIIAVSFSLAGLGIALAAYCQLILLLRLLATDGILPRHVAAADAHGSRRAVFGVIALTCAVAVYLIASPLGGSTMVVTIMFVGFLLTMVALLARARKLRRASTDLRERQNASRSTRTALVLGLFVLSILAISTFVQPVFTVAGLTILAIPSVALLALRRGMGKIGATLAASDLSAGRSLPTRVHAIVLVEKLDRPTLQAISYVRATRPSTMTGLVVDVDPQVTEALTRDWMAAELPVELRILGTPRGAARRPVIEHVRSLRRASARDIVIIYAPRVVSPSATWQRFFVRHSTPALLSELKLEPGVIVAEVPYQIEDVEEQ
ncbi:APC family permease [Flaviflexus equikiangi]|uniref:APC family permease n=1 Tax=Flaviflexus equikiangi TaxID=2758573 RepID=A0ABS2TF63_9ACTO|nr:APC family permease [Flaviflexus equikiangi]MBM9433296.1 APC family permease [Flaviflexus equikiangi]